MNQVQILDSEIESLVLTKNALIKDINNLRDEVRFLENQIREAHIRLDNLSVSLKQNV